MENLLNSMDFNRESIEFYLNLIGNILNSMDFNRTSIEFYRF